jgi:UDP-N-acetylglucosamine 4,6-dehydratase
VIINIAGAKHAPLGEEHIEETLNINTLGVINLLKHKGKAKLIQCSTCKSANPETVYGATKLISERLVLNAGGVVARFFNVVETSGNVFEIWKDKQTIDVAGHCNRYFISLAEATGLLLRCITLKSGRYLVNSPKLINMIDVANACYPERPKRLINQRRGDRLTEIWLATNETISEYLFEDSIIKVSSTHDK